MGFIKNLNQTISSIRKSYEGKDYVLRQTERSYNQLGKFIDKFSQGKISPERFVSRLETTISDYQDALKDSKQRYAEVKATHSYEEFLRETIAGVKRNAVRLTNETARNMIASKILLQYMLLRGKLDMEITGAQDEKEEAEQEKMFKDFVKKEGLGGIFD